ncbi:MAG: 50S ribosomal protein L3 N(5)-glutamine methyltransferase [Gammaproteobacteria bacterium]|nr:50S ribosomal protein L3 N(5)-glutamine methyltransferase [Gammaproteobacteria bacterium]
MSIDNAIQAIAELFNENNIFFGHGTDNALDEAAELVTFILKINFSSSDDISKRVITNHQWEEINKLALRRIETRKPLPYLTNQAYFCHEKFYVDERVLIPRSPISEMIQNYFKPWLNNKTAERILEIGTGSGCIAIAIAKYFENSLITATDVSRSALEVASINVKNFSFEKQIELIQSDLFENIQGKYNLIVSNPPYVPRIIMNNLPQEYAFEPTKALLAGDNGLDFIARILHDAPLFLEEDGILVIEAGVASIEMERQFKLPFKWIDFELGGEGVAVIEAKHLQ